MTISVDIKLDPRVSLKARRTLNGDIMIMDHEDIDIVLMHEKKKFVTFPKDNMSDKVYSAQDRIFKFLANKGLISRNSVRGGNVFGSLEAEMLESKIPGIDQMQAFLYSVHQYIQEEKPYFKSSADYEEDRLDSLLLPDNEDSTDLGDVPQSDKKGSMDSRVRPFGFQYNYSLVREGESED
jgi:hypothetical protein